MRTSSAKIQRKRVSDQVIEYLISLITGGQLKAGDKLPPEPKLMEELGVGRSSIREAVGALELVGLLVVRPGDGTRVADSTDGISPRSVGLSLITIGQEKVRDLVEMRTELEQSIAMFAAERASAEDMNDIRMRHQKLIQARKSGRSLILADLEFHTAIANACHNDIMVKFFNELRQPIRQWMNQKSKYDWGFDGVVKEHELIVQAIESGDPQKARMAMRSHITKAGDKLISALSETCSE
jgi:GntR family transcriptional repressor for pyruvate dehydrogenase complex